MADYAGAKAAIKARLEAGWTTTRKTYQNEQPAEPWPPVDANKVLLPWVNLEIHSTGSQIWTFGTEGNRGWRYDGTIMVHVFAPVGSGDALADQYALAIGELFRAAKFYDDGLGSYIRTLAPGIDDGGTGDDDGTTFRVTMTVDFTYWHRG
ncbi:phage tail terminator-like protein [Mesorhizobium sp. M6A.T.Ce.TU.016.01.1.1]|uniref:phage tail terminator-like protein n=1 Tax=Mesorhizobium sp. M6A.T.Ce.TU.016.01.1.1 TaxID=2496783 RepID=UPI000FCBC925|nr:phage tail terminator-like protein [Mesorhizobium sp. M6A.T.Ce.TU.016.01.1.1]RUU29763.1 hypothetical protein EOC94_12920 [Mesorhizobium sp. M6A.T.Ce.TU.016.01.1.1]